MTRVRRAPLVGVGMLLLAAAGWWWFRQPPQLSVQVGVVTEGPLRATVNELGTTRVRGHTDVNAPVAGRWVPAALREGDVVPRTARLGMLYPAPMDATMREQARARLGSTEALVREAEARVSAARTARDDAQRSRVRVEALGAAGAVAPQDVERARDSASTAETQLLAAEERLRALRFERNQAAAALAGANGTGSGLPIESPLAGTVLTIGEPHERVVPAGTRLLEVGDPRDLEVVVPLLTADAMRVREDATARLTFGDATAGRAAEGARDTVPGKVVRVEPSAYTRLSALGVEEQRVNVVIAVPATAVHLGDHFRAEARITVWESPRVLRVPGSALVRDGNQWSAWRIRDGRVQRVAVHLGERGDDLVEVRAGLAAGDSVVLFPTEKVVEGQRLRLNR